MAPIPNKRRRVEDEVRKPKKKIRVKRQKHYHSSSEDEGEDAPVVSDAPVKRMVDGKPQPKSILKQARKASPPLQDVVAEESEGNSDEDEGDNAEGLGLDETEKNTALNAAPTGEDSDDEASGASSENDGDDNDELLIAQDAPSSEASDLDDSGAESIESNQASKTRKKRNDPTAFANSISRILSTKLTTTNRAAPILSRNPSATAASQTQTDTRLEAAARQQLKHEKRVLLEKGRQRDVLGLSTPDVSTASIQEEEKRLKKVAQRGVVRLFNAVRAAQVRAEQGEEIVRGEGVVGVGQRKERVGEMSKEGFLELISRGGSGSVEA